jgi:dTDP-4-amino-4,6-dideoxygalactose transaminase
MDAITAIANRYGLVVVEDNAHGIGATYRGRRLGTLGALATQSFHETKNVQCGEGGALMFNDMRYFHRAEIVREKGTNRSQFFRGMVDKYRWIDIGSLPAPTCWSPSPRSSEPFAEIQRKRHAIWGAYHARLAGWPPTTRWRSRPSADRGTGPPVPAAARPHRDFCDWSGGSTFHYQPLHSHRPASGTTD